MPAVTAIYTFAYCSGVKEYGHFHPEGKMSKFSFFADHINLFVFTNRSKEKQRAEVG